MKTQQMQHFKTTKLRSGFFRCRIVETGYYGHGATPGEARLSALRLQEGNGDSPLRPLEQHQILENLREVIYADYGNDTSDACDNAIQLIERLAAQRDELLAAGQKAFRAMEEAIRSLPIGHEAIKELEAARSAIAKCEAQP